MDQLMYRPVEAARLFGMGRIAIFALIRSGRLLSMLGLPDPEDTGRYRWETVTPANPDFMTRSRHMLHVLAARARSHEALTEASNRAQEGDSLSAAGRAA